MSDPDLRYLEGEAAIADRIKALSGRTPNSTQKAFASSCLLHGRLFWESAAAAPLDTKPLLLYYGAAAFAKALVLTFTGCLPQDLSQAHGLRCYPGDGDLIANFTMKANGLGLFQQFNDVVAPLNRLQYFEGTSRQTRILPAAASDRLTKFEARLIDCLSRVPDAEDAYRLSTNEEPRLVRLYFSEEPHFKGDFSIRIDAPRCFDGLETFKEIVSDIREKVPFLNQWQVRQGQLAWDKTVLFFHNCKGLADELDDMIGSPQHFECGVVSSDQFDAFNSLPPLAQGDGGYAAYLEPIGGEDLSEYSIMLAALLGLSSIVRYHPHTWTACIYRRSISGRPVDDALLPVLEVFLASVQSRFPRFIADAILGR